MIKERARPFIAASKSKVTFATTSAMDMATTVIALQNPKLYEHNPIQFNILQQHGMEGFLIARTIGTLGILGAVACLEIAANMLQRKSRPQVSRYLELSRDISVVYLNIDNLWMVGGNTFSIMQGHY